MNRGNVWTTHESQTTYTGFNFTVQSDSVQLPSGEEMDFEFVTEPDAVAVLAFTDDDTVLVVSEWRQTVRRYVQYGLPGGGIEPDETPIVAARRELREETGYEAGDLSPLLSTEPTNGMTNGLHRFFRATNCQKVGEPTSEDTAEQTTVREVPFDDLLNATCNGAVTDARTVQPVLFHALTADR